MQSTALLLINGQRVPADSGETTLLKNPHNGLPVASVAEAGPSDIDAAVNHGLQAFKSWSATTMAERAQLLKQLALLLGTYQEELLHLESITSGKPVKTAGSEVQNAANYLDYYAGTIDRKVHDNADAASNTLNMREPYGLCGMIMPWDYPLMTAVRHCAPALAMGNTVLVKPAVRTPLSTLRFGELALEAGFPPGVINVVTGRGTSAGESLARHPLVPLISFCGSTTTGKDILKYGAYEIKRMAMDLGGKSAAIMLPDADIPSAVTSVVASITGNSGQNHQAKSRLLISNRIYQEVIDQLIEQFSTIRIGDPADPATDMGPLISQRQQERVLKYIELGSSAGANIKFGGKVPSGEELQSGYYIEPTLFVDVDPQMYIAREEIFGPLLCVIPFADDEDAITINNDSIYGITASIWTADIDRAKQMARRLDVGSVTINSDNLPPLSCLTSRRKHSGIGEITGNSALHHYSQAKTILVD